MAGKELKAHRRRDENEPGHIRSPEEKLPTLNQGRPVEAGDRIAFLFGRLDLFGRRIAFARDDKVLSAGGAMRSFSTVLVGETNDRSAVRTVELDRHLLYLPLTI